ncbi:MAG: carboxypeptidase-like regulatory domain-containing protein [Planctomycetaceae bacterium]|jgi:hypothetical protein|nr:carboxypeptidase-like regulatory domain-containing protein [Planctomycetaceae bacterium]
MKISTLFPLLLLICFVFSGCQKNDRPADLPKLYPCRITVTQETVPLAGASITLQAVNGSGKYQVSSGRTDSAGIATIYTYGFVGVPLGDYKITISKVSTEGGTRQADSFGGGKVVGTKDYQLVDNKFTENDTTPAKITITEKSNDTSIDVGKAVHQMIPSMPVSPLM